MCVSWLLLKLLWNYLQYFPQYSKYTQFITRPFLNQLIHITVITTSNNRHYLLIQLTSWCRACFNNLQMLNNIKRVLSLQKHQVHHHLTADSTESTSHIPKIKGVQPKFCNEILISTLHAMCYDHLICPDVVHLQNYRLKAHIKNVNKRGNVHVTEHSGAFMQPFKCGKTINITYFKCAFVALAIQHTMHMHYIVICGLPGAAIFFRIIS